MVDASARIPDIPIDREGGTSTRCRVSFPGRRGRRLFLLCLSSPPSPFCEQFKIVLLIANHHSPISNVSSTQQDFISLFLTFSIFLAGGASERLPLGEGGQGVWANAKHHSRRFCHSNPGGQNSCVPLPHFRRSKGLRNLGWQCTRWPA
jgi:hypothetical protein